MSGSHSSVQVPTFPVIAGVEFAMIPGYSWRAASDDGRIWKCRGSHGAPLGQWTPCETFTQRGYPKVSVDHRPRFIHRLILLAFVGPCPEGMEVSHLNGNRFDSRLTNLKYETHVDNNGRRFDHGTVLKGDSHPNRKLGSVAVCSIRKMAEEGVPNRTTAAQFSVSISTIQKIVNGSYWKQELEYDRPK